MTEEEEIQRGRQADMLMGNQLLKSAFSDIEAAVVDELRRVAVGDASRQRDLIVTLQVVGNVQRILRTHIETGKLAMLQKESMAKRMLRRLA